VTSPIILLWSRGVRKTPHITHKGGSWAVSHVQSLISRLAGREKIAQQLLSVGLTKVAFGRKQGQGTDKERWWEIRDSGL
jgi:hypothetical protein